jgi:hypothetical protein
VRIRERQPYQASLTLPRSFAGFFGDGGSLLRGPAASVWRKGARLGAYLALQALLGGCNDGYTAPPTFCDDWCAALRHPSDCSRGPASCVRDCELTKASGDCFALQQELLTCYQGLEADAFLCAPPGSQSSFADRQRVEKTACREERDVLFECEAPGFGECLDLCRGYQVILTQGAAGDGLGVPASDDCVLLTQPCESVCWTAFAFTSDDLERLRLPPAGGAGETNDTDSGAPLDAGPVTPRDPLRDLFAPCFEISDAGARPQ